MLRLNKSFLIGLSFGLTSATITTLGLIIGLYASTNSKLTVVGGILTIAIADAFSDALGIHISQESQEDHSDKRVWESTIATFLSKFLFAVTFLVPILFLSLGHAVIICVVYGLILLSVFSYLVALRNKESSREVVLEHLLISVLVIITTFGVGRLISECFG